MPRLFLPTHKFAIPDWDDERIDSIIGHCSTKHWPKCVFMIDCVIGNKDAAGYHIGNDGFVTLGIDLFLRIEKAKGHIGAVGEMVKCVGVDKVHDIADIGRFECLTCQLGFLVENFERCYSSVDKATRQGEPESGVACTGPYLNISSGRSGCGE